MDCPQCKTPHPDDAVFCSLCFAPFKARPKAPAGGFAAFPNVLTVFEGFRIMGPLVIKPEALWFFMKDCEKAEEGRAGTIAGNALGGVVGDLIGSAINAAVDNMNEAPRFRPEKLSYTPVRHVVEEFSAAMGDAPLIPACRDCYSFEKKDLTELSFSSWTGTLTLKTRWLEVSVDGVDPREKASAYFKLRGYPLKE